MESTMERATVTAPDISCGHCVAAIKEAVGGLAGVERVEPDVATKRVEVAFDPRQVSLAQIEAAMDDAGYPIEK